MSALLPWLAILGPLLAAGALLWLRAPIAGWAGLAAAAVALAATMALGAPEGGAPEGGAAAGIWRTDALALLLAPLVAIAAVLAAGRARRAGGPAMARVLAVLAALELAVLASDMALAWVGLAGAMLVLLAGVRGAVAWRGAMTILPLLALLLFAIVLLHQNATAPAPGVLSLGFILMLPGLAACAGLAPLHGWQRGVARDSRAVAALVPAVAAVALGMLLRLRTIVLAQDSAVALGPVLLALGPVLLALGLASLVWAVLTVWRESPASAAGAVTLFPVGLATIAFGLGSTAADQAGLIVLAGAVLLAPLAAAQGRAGAAALAVLALLPPFALFGAALAVLAEAVDAAPWLVVPLAGLMAAGAAGLARAAVAAWPQQRGWSADDSAAALVLALALAAGTVPAVAGWFAAVARGIR